MEERENSTNIFLEKTMKDNELHLQRSEIIESFENINITSREHQSNVLQNGITVCGFFSNWQADRNEFLKFKGIIHLIIILYVF